MPTVFWLWEGECPSLSKGDLIVGLDIGTSAVRVIIGEISGHSVNIIGVGTAKSDGIKKGSIIDIDKTVLSIRAAIDHAERMVGITIHAAFVGVSGSHISLEPSHSVIAVQSEDREIAEEDVARVVAAARTINLPPEREIVDVVPREYTVDGLSEVSDPRGMLGVRLEVDAYVVTGAKTVLHNLLRCVERAGIEVLGTVFMPLAAAELVLSEDEKNLGVLLADIGAGSTTLTIFERGVLSKYAVIPLGGDIVTSDITVGLQTGTEAAESVKCKYGTAEVGLALEEEKFKVSRIGSNVEKEFTSVDLAYIIEPRMQEIYQFIFQEVEHLGYPQGLPGGYVFTGGGMLLKGASQLAELELNSPVRIAYPDFVGVRDPSYVGCVGLIHHIARYYQRSASSTNASNKRVKSGTGTIQRIKNWIQDFI